MLAVVAPAAPALAIPALVGIAFVFFVAALGAWAALKLFDYTLGLLLDEVSDLIDAVPLIGGFGARQLLATKNYMRARLADAVEGLDAQSARFWQGAKDVTEWTADSIVEFGRDVHATVAGIVGVTIPGLVRAGTAPIDTRLDRVNRSTRAREQAEAQARTRGIDRVSRDLTAEKLARERGIDATTARINARIRGLDRTLRERIASVQGYTWRQLRAARARLTRAEQVLLGGAVAGVALATLTRYFPWWRCSNVRGFNRALCRMPLGLLNELLAAGLAVLVLSDVCRIGSLVRAGAELAQPVLLGLVGVVDAATECTSYPKPPALPLAATQLPAVADPLAL